MSCKIHSMWVYLKEKKDEKYIPVCKHYSSISQFNDNNYHISISKEKQIKEDFKNMTDKDINELLTEEEFIKKYC